MQRENTEIRQKQIKKAVLKILAEEGLHRLTTRNLAGQIGLSEGALFRHFKSKRDILLGIMDDVQLEMVEPLRQIASSDRPAPDRLSDFLRCHVRFLVENRGITILLFSEAAHFNDSALKGKMRTILLNLKQSVANIIRDGMAAGEWDPALQVEDVTILYMGIPIALNVELVLNPEGLRTENFCVRMEELIRRALYKRQK